MDNRTLGTRFEQQFADLLFGEGFWVHLVAQTQVGQAADIIAVKDTKAYLIDCKVCSDNKFSKSRIESNQLYAMTLWKLSGNGCGWFALKVSDGVYMLSIDKIPEYTMNIAEIKTAGIEVREWIKQLQ